MVKKIYIIIILTLLSYIIVSKFLHLKVDPCDIECDNCMDSVQCEQCYEDCYNNQRWLKIYQIYLNRGLQLIQELLGCIGLYLDLFVYVIF